MKLACGDITIWQVDAIVNAANPSLLGGAGVDGAIHAAGGPAILDACRQVRRQQFPDGLPTGQAVATTAGLLRARWVIHTVGPIFGYGHVEQLRSCYVNSLDIAARCGAHTIAFPLISAGAYGWPVEDAIRQALSVLATATLEVELVLFSTTTLALAEGIAAKLA